MTAETLALALNGKRYGKEYRALCPVHEGDQREHHPSLAIADGRCGRPVLKCWAGCDQRVLIRTLMQRGLWSPPPGPSLDAREMAQALAWREWRLVTMRDWIDALDALKAALLPKMEDDAMRRSWVKLCREQKRIREEMRQLAGLRGAELIAARKRSRRKLPDL